MRATVFLGNIVGVGKDVFYVRIIPLQGNLNSNTVFGSLMGEMENLVYRSFVLI